ncbi:MAG: hypothetical protein L0170_10385, partial [Acidobacteria bacterium]|nr:hypothetical protein [Acidobacteriota bacterium]
MEPRVIPGVRVLVPLGDSRRVGVVVGRQEEPAHLLKDIVEVLDDHPLLDPPLLDFTRWVSDYYFAPWGMVLQAALPLELRIKVVRRLRLLSAGREALEHPFADLTAPARHVLDLLARQGDLAESRVRKLIPKAGPQLIEELARRGRVEILKESHLPDRRPRSEEWLRATGDTRRAPLRGAVQRRVLDLLNRTTSAVRMAEVCAMAGVTSAQIRALARGGRIVLERREASKEPSPFKLPDGPSLVLTS